MFENIRSLLSKSPSSPPSQSKDPVAKTVGLDISSTAVRAVEVSGVVDGFIQISKFAVIQLQPGAVQAGRIVDTSAVVAAIEEAFKSAGLSKRRVIAGIETPDTAIGARALPAGSSAPERESAIRYDSTPLSSRLDADASDISTYTAAGMISAEGQEFDEVVFGAAHKAAVAELDHVCELAGIKLHAIDLNGAALMRSLVFDVDSDEAFAVADIGATKTMVVARRGLHVRSLRTVEYGGMDITRSLAKVAGGFPQAERQKRVLRPASSITRTDAIRVGYGDEDEVAVVEHAEESNLTETYTSCLSTLVDHIAMGVEAARRQGTPPTTLTITGLSTGLHGLTAELSERLGMPVTIGRPWIQLVGNEDNQKHLSNTDTLPTLTLSLAVAAGLATWEDRS